MVVVLRPLSSEIDDDEFDTGGGDGGDGGGRESDGDSGNGGGRESNGGVGCSRADDDGVTAEAKATTSRQ